MGFFVIVFSAPNTSETRTVSRGRKPQSIYLLQLIGITWIVAPLRQVNNKITRPKHVLKKDLFLFLWSNRFQLATEQEKVAISATAWNTQLPFMLQRAPVPAGKGAWVFCKEQLTEVPWSCNVASNPCQWRTEWIQISCASTQWPTVSAFLLLVLWTYLQSHFILLFILYPAGFINKYKCQSYIYGTCTVFIFPALIRRHQSFLFFP